MDSRRGRLLDGGGDVGRESGVAVRQARSRFDLCLRLRSGVARVQSRQLSRFATDDCRFASANQFRRIGHFDPEMVCNEIWIHSDRLSNLGRV